ncbi:hypothetical protein HDU67_005712 [Dinochytrium kinnereticum]|nr:hypothetical protein HDU67_005712 [Dinochytrium kinnereticum]
MAKSRSPSVGATSATAASPNKTVAKTAQVQAQVDEVINVMHNNIEKVIARGEKLDSLQSKTEDLKNGAIQFRKGAAKVKSQIMKLTE